ncbi:MAG: sensor histidine kinase [Proteobacteria bacterium]|nr:sensor histidine kinase [Pseudomonadota bacterium]
MRASNGSPWMRFIPLYGLIWTFWLFASPWFGQVPMRQWLWQTMATLPLFLVLYACAYYRPLRWIVANALGIAVLGYLLTPYNWGACTYVIYACAFLAFAPTPLRAFALMILVLVPYLLIGYAQHLPWPFLLSMAVMALAIGGSNIAYRSSQVKDAQLQVSHEEIRRLAATAERERIGRDLHDLLGHTLSLIALKSELAGKLLSRDPAAARREIGEVERTAREALAQVRSAVTGMRAAGLVGEAASARTMLECVGVRFAFDGFDRALPSAQENCLALVLREAATNIQRHARATSARAQLSVEREVLVLRISDDGQGAIRQHGNGLTGMRERIEALGGSLRISGERGQGAVIEACLPLPPSNVIGIADAPRKISA